MLASGLHMHTHRDEDMLEHTCTYVHTPHMLSKMREADSPSRHIINSVIK